MSFDAIRSGVRFNTNILFDTQLYCAIMKLIHKRIDMIKGTIPNYYFIQQMPEHETRKAALLESFEKSEFDTIDSPGEQITISDWRYAMRPREWTAAFKEFAKPLVEEVQNELLADNGMYDAMWFQQYFATDYHGWHVHNHTNYSSIYLVECPDGMATEFFDITTKTKFKEIQLKEGDVITFPAQVYHRSAPNNTSGRKTIISYNCNFTSKTEDAIVKTLGNPEDEWDWELHDIGSANRQ